MTIGAPGGPGKLVNPGGGTLNGGIIGGNPAIGGSGTCGINGGVPMPGGGTKAWGGRLGSLKQ